MKEYIDLFLTFAKIGGFTFGGGYAMLPMMQRELVEKKNWTTNEELLNYYAVGQCTPGIIAVNTATFVGYKRKGILGGAAATAGIVTPSVIIIILIASLLKNFAAYPIVQHAFSGIRIAVCATILVSIVNLWKKSVKKFSDYIFCIVAFLLSAFTPISPVWIVLLAGMGGIFTNPKKEEETK
ncbi:MAG: chromate transporter [Clostridia bacterium]|nr:chromate transporter [Clostridia bacterium]